MCIVSLVDKFSAHLHSQTCRCIRRILHSLDGEKFFSRNEIEINVRFIRRSKTIVIDDKKKGEQQPKSCLSIENDSIISI